MTNITRERILVTVKTYPTLSKKYGETVCTAGIREDGSWVRLYPVPFRRLDEHQQYKKYDWIECDVHPRPNDPRLESFCPVDRDKIKKVGHIDTRSNWRERRRLLTQTAKVHDRLDTLIKGAKENSISLAVFRPTALNKFIHKREDPHWDPEKLRQIEVMLSQPDLFDDNDTWRRPFEVIRKLPYSFSYKFMDSSNRVSTLQILDWEIGALYWNCLKKAGNCEKHALEKVQMKYWDQFTKQDLHFFLGTTLQFHQRAPNPWVIIGVLPLPNIQSPYGNSTPLFPQL